MKRSIKYFALLLTALFILSLLSCQSIESKLNNIEEKYSKEFREELENIDEKENLTQESQQQFSEEMIKNRLTFPEDIQPSGEWIKPGGEVPLWLIQELVIEDKKIEDYFVISCVVAGELRTEFGKTGQNEFILPVAFKNPDTGKFYVRNVSFGTEEFLEAHSIFGGMGTVILDDNTLTANNPEFVSTQFNFIKSNFKIGNQIAFIIPKSIQILEVPEDIAQTEEWKKIYETFEAYSENNTAFCNALIDGKDLPEGVIKPSALFINKDEQILEEKEREASSVEDEGITIPAIEGLEYDAETNTFFATEGNPYGLEAETKAGVFLKGAFEIDNVMEDSIGLVSEVIEYVQNEAIKEFKELRFPIPFNLAKNEGVSMQLLEDKFANNNEKLEEYRWDNFTFLGINVPKDTIIYSPLRSFIVDERSGGFSFDYYISEDLLESKEIHDSAFYSSIDVPDDIQKQIYFNEVDEINSAGLEILVQGAEPIISSFETRESNSENNVKTYNAGIGTPLFIINKEPSPEIEWYFQWGNLDAGSFSINIIYNIAQVDYEKHKTIKMLETGKNIFLEIKSYKIFIIPEDDFPTEEMLFSRDKKFSENSQTNQNNSVSQNIITEENSFEKGNRDITFPIKIKTLVLNYDPKLESHNNKYLHELCGFNDPRKLAEGYISNLNGCSGGKVVYEIVDWIDINDMIPYTDGFKYTGESFYENFQKASSERWDWWGWDGWHAHEKNQASGMADFFWIINTNNLVERINSDEIDEVLIFAQPFSGMYESLMIGPNPIWCNSNPLVVTELNKNFIIMGFNYHREVDCMLESFGHRVESILTHIFNKDSGEINYWEKFTLYDKIAPGEAGCGNVHFAPNSESDYDWGNSRYVYSTCDDWLNYPNLTGEKREVNCSEWGNGDMRLHHIWWLSHIPKADGLDSNGMLNNWWGYFAKY